MIRCQECDRWVPESSIHKLPACADSYFNLYGFGFCCVKYVCKKCDFSCQLCNHRSNDVQEFCQMNDEYGMKKQFICKKCVQVSNDPDKYKDAEYWMGISKEEYERRYA